MARANLTFHKCIQDSQDYGSNDEHMVSRVFFTFTIAGKEHPDLYADIKQTVGGDFESGPIEVSRPHGYKGPINYQAFRDAVEKYYRSLVGSKGRGIAISGGRNIRMRNNTFIQEMSFEFDVDESEVGW
ncbi:MAG: hypothetical protein ABSA70_16230 [Terriglobia bacterium]